jgi:hypothetical protein
MKTKDVIRLAERYTVDHVYDDGTLLYDLLVDGKAYTIRAHPDDFLKLRTKPEKGTEE